MALEHEHAPSVALGAIGVAALTAGAWLYVTDRHPAQVQLLPAGWHWPQAGGLLSPKLSGSLPSALHVLGFGLLTAGCLPSAARQRACIAWLLVDAVLEFAQLGGVQRSLPLWTSPFLPHGTFDLLDLAALVIGTALAMLICTLVAAPAGDRSSAWSRRPRPGCPGSGAPKAPPPPL